MDITSLAAWGEFLGGVAVAVVVSSIYLGEKICRNSKQIGARTTAANLQIRLTTYALMVRALSFPEAPRPRLVEVTPSNRSRGRRTSTRRKPGLRAVSEPVQGGRR